MFAHSWQRTGVSNGILLAGTPRMYAAQVNDWAKGSPQRAPVVFRSATLSDHAAIIKLWRLAGVASEPNDADGDHDNEGQDHQEITTRLARDAELFVLAEQDGELVASVMGCYDGHRGWIKRFAVHPSHQRTGLGRRLNAELEARFTAAGITELRLSAWRSNERALDFWNSMGFDEIDIAYFTKSLR